MAIEIKGLIKRFSNSTSDFVLNIPYIFLPSNGLCAIYGKSGCGKSTLLNLLSLVDQPDEGEIIVNGNNIVKYSKSDRLTYRNKEIGIVFQHYNLLEDETVLFNIKLPLLISGVKDKEATQEAKSLLNKIDFNSKLFDKKAALLSGGEKQRIAILRAIINNPSIIFADEPTGALDENNSKNVLELIKESSKKRLVILVSHNRKIVDKYADYIIEMKDGKIISNSINKIDIIESKHKIKKKHNYLNLWSNSLVKTNLSKRKKRNLISGLAISVGLIFSTLIIGFNIASVDSISNYSKRQFDYGSFSLYKETNYKIDNSNITITKQNKISDEEIIGLSDNLHSFYIEPNFSKLLLNNSISIEQIRFDNYNLCPVYDFTDNYVLSNLLIMGRMPNKTSKNEILINDSFYNYVSKTNNIDLLNKRINFECEFENVEILENLKEVSDSFIYKNVFLIVGVVSEMPFLSTNKIFYSYLNFEEYLLTCNVENLSKELSTNISWFTYVADSKDDSTCEYSNKMFIKDIKNIDNEINKINTLPNPYKATSNCLMASSALVNLFDAASMGMDLFLFFCLFGVALIIGIISFSSYSEDRKLSAILSCLGCEQSTIKSIYEKETLFTSLLSLFLSIPFSIFLSKIINICVEKAIGLKKIIQIPFKEFLNIPFLLPFLLFAGVIFFTLISTLLPIYFSKKISLSKELKDE